MSPVVLEPGADGLRPAAKKGYRELSPEEARAEVDAATKMCAAYARREQDAAARVKQADAVLATCEEELNINAPRLWAEGHATEADKLEAGARERQAQAQEDRHRAERQRAQARQLHSTAVNLRAQTVRNCLPVLAIAAHNQHVVRLAEVQGRAAEVLQELLAAHAAFAGAVSELSPALKEFATQGPADNRVADRVRLPQLPVDRDTVRQLVDFDPRSEAMVRLVEEFSVDSPQT